MMLFLWDLLKDKKVWEMERGKEGKEGEEVMEMFDFPLAHKMFKKEEYK